MFFNSINNFLPLHTTRASVCKFTTILRATKYTCYNLCVLIVSLISSILTEHFLDIFKKTTTEPHLGNKYTTCTTYTCFYYISFLNTIYLHGSLSTVEIISITLSYSLFLSQDTYDAIVSKHHLYMHTVRLMSDHRN